MNDNTDAKSAAASLRTLERGLDVLDCFHKGVGKLSLTEIAARIQLNPSTTSRILSTLEKRSYLLRNAETKKYQLGPQLLHLMSPSQAFDLSSLAEPYMCELRELYNESVTLYIVIDDKRCCVNRIETTHALRRVINIGEQLPLTRGASGKMLLACLPEERRQALWAADPAVPYEELIKIRQQGYAMSAGEREDGVSAISAPIFDASSQVIAALAIAGPTVRLSQETLTAMLPALRQKAADISLVLGYHP